MRLTTILFRITRPPHGFKYRGKNRVVKPIKHEELTDLRKDYERTEKNMLILRHPYLTVEQSLGHVRASGVDTQTAFWEKVHDERRKKFERHVTLAERLSHLKITEAWD